MDNKLQQLENRIKQLEKWKQKKEQQQISFPIDTESIDILKKYFMRIETTINYTAGASGNPFTTFIGSQGEREFALSKNTFISYTVNPSNDEFKCNTYLSNGIQIVFLSDGTPPSPISAGVPYYIINASGTTFEISTTSGGSAVDITDTGTGRQYFQII